MSSVTEKCERLVLSNTDFLVKNVLPFLVTALVLRGVFHELAHGLMNGLTGGTFGFASNAGNIIGGYGIKGFYLIEPVLFVHWRESGNEILALIAGPASIILLFWVVAHYNNRFALNGPCDGRNSWLRRRGWVYGTMAGGIMDTVYMLPISPFPESGGGDGIAIYYWFIKNGYAWMWDISVLGTETTINANPAYLIGAVAIVGTTYYTLLTVGVDVRGLPSRLLGCTFPSDQVCRI